MKLVIVPTPIGNLEDITLRALRALEECEVIVCEDTRRTRKLLSHFNIATRLETLNDINESKQSSRIVKMIESGRTVALVSDAGMPSIADPGYRLIQLCIEAGIQAEVLPGPSAVITALVASGFETARFCFEGFLPKSKGGLRRALQTIAGDERTVVAFESPRRILFTLALLAEIAPERQVAVARELTKIHEAVLRGTSAEVASRLGESVRGEITLVIEGHKPEGDLVGAIAEARRLVKEGQSTSRAAASAARKHNSVKAEVYRALVKKKT